MLDRSLYTNGSRSMESFELNSIVKLICTLIKLVYTANILSPTEPKAKFIKAAWFLFSRAYTNGGVSRLPLHWYNFSFVSNAYIDRISHFYVSFRLIYSKSLWSVIASGAVSSLCTVSVFSCTGMGCISIDTLQPIYSNRYMFIYLDLQKSGGGGVDVSLNSLFAQLFFTAVKTQC